MPDSEKPFTEQLDQIRRTRDELRLKIHLAADEAREEWERAEVIWSRLQGELQRLASVSERPTKQLRAGADGLLREVAIAYGRIRAALQRPIDP